MGANYVEDEHLSSGVAGSQSRSDEKSNVNLEYGIMENKGDGKEVRTT